MSKLGDEVLLSLLRMSASGDRKKDDDPITSFKKMSKLMKAMKEGEKKPDEKKKEGLEKYISKEALTLLIFTSIPIMVFFQFFMLYSTLITIAEKLHH